MWLECVVEYWDDDPESSKRKLYKRHVLTKAVSYTDAEATATAWAIEETSEDFEIAPIKLLTLYEVIQREKCIDFYEVKAVYYEETSRGKLKAYKLNLLIQSNDPEEVTSIAKDYLQKNISSRSEIKSITKTEIEKIL